MREKKKQILVATTNPGKIAEMKAMLGDGVNWLGLGDVGGIDEIAEDGATFAENARKKALGYARACGLWTIADDSGLVIDALGGAPGVKSARFSGDKWHGLPARGRHHGQSLSRSCRGNGRATDADRTLIDHRNIARVLQLLAGVPREKRTARFVCRLCLASPQEVLIETEGVLEGIITDRQIGENGFGYDPIMFVPHLNKTVAQLTSDEKNAISHRGNAIRKLTPLLLELLRDS